MDCITPRIQFWILSSRPRFEPWNGSRSSSQSGKASSQADSSITNKVLSIKNSDDFQTISQLHHRCILFDYISMNRYVFDNNWSLFGIRIVSQGAAYHRYLLLTQQPQVRFLAFPRIFLLMLQRFIDSTTQNSGESLIRLIKNPSSTGQWQTTSTKKIVT